MTKQGDKIGQWNVEQRQAEEGFGGFGGQLASRDGGLPHLPDSGPTAIPTRSGLRFCVIWPAQSGSTPPFGQGRILELGGSAPVYTGNPGGEANSLANRAGGVRMALRRLEIDESRHIANYGTQLKALGDEGSIAILEHVIEDEKDHHRELGSLLARPLQRCRRLSPASIPKPFWMNCWPSAARAASSPAVGSAMPSMASTTASAPSSASSPAFPVQPRAKANTCSLAGLSA